VSFYFLIGLSLLYSENIHNGYRTIQHSIPLLFFPVVSYFVAEELSKNTFDKLIATFYLASLVLGLYILIYLFYHYELDYILNGAVVSHVLNKGKLILDVHPIYSSVFFLFSILIGLNNLLTLKLSLSKKVFYIFSLAIFLLSILILSSKAILLTLIISLIFFLFKFRATIQKKMIVLIAMIGICFIVMVKFTTVKNRVNDFFIELKNTNINREGSTYLRLTTYKCSLDIIKTNFLAGVGIGDVQTELNKCYSNKGIQTDIKSTHNFYLAVFSSAGIFALILFLISQFYNLKLASDTTLKETLYVDFTIIFLIIMLFEDYLFRSYGVIFYGLINHVYYRRYIKIGP